LIVHGDPGSIDARFAHAAALEEQGKYAEALEEWRGLSSDHKDATVLCRLAIVAEQLGYIEEAEGAFREAIKIDDRESSAYVGLASILITRSEYEDAFHLLREALSLEKNAYTYTILGVALNRAGREEEAKANLEVALVLDPTYEEAYFNLGLIKRRTDQSEAERLFLKALEIDPEYSNAHRELGWLFNKRGDFVQAEYHIRRSLELKADDAWARIYLGNLLWRKGDVAGTIPEFERAIALMRDSAVPLLSLANVYEDQGRWQEAQGLYDRAVETEPDNAVARMNYARMLAKRGDIARAATELKVALSLDPNYPAAHELLKRIKIKDEGKKNRKQHGKLLP
jgi:tetratricopeptide (TPR) repeat protein